MFGDMAFFGLAYTGNNQADIRTQNIDDMFCPFSLTAKIKQP
jgi:hypothetical protein